MHVTQPHHEVGREVKKLEVKVKKVSKHSYKTFSKASSISQPKEPQSVAKSVSGSHKDWLRSAGIPESVWGCAEALVQRESGWNVSATNPSSSAYGLPQSLPGNKMASHGSDWRTNPVTQLRWMNDYTQARYGGWCEANSFQINNNWY